MTKLYRSAVPTLLLQTCNTLFQSQLFEDFSIGGGLALALRSNHRRTNEIDLYSHKPVPEDTVKKMERFFQYSFGMTDHQRLSTKNGNMAFFVYNLNGDFVKIELHTVPSPLAETHEQEGLRLLSETDVTKILLRSIVEEGKKSEYWDLHALLEMHPAEELLLHFENVKSESGIRSAICDFSRADNDFEPQCLRGKDWNLIKLDIFEAFAGSEIFVR
jgi:hypothetical protein